MQGKQVYIADDDSQIRAALKAFLENAGFGVTDFAYGEQLLEHFIQTPADLVILDVMMPGMSGFLVCKQLRKISDVPVILLTSRDSELDYKTAMDLGASFYYTKPTSPMSIVSKAKELFDLGDSHVDN